MKMGEANKRGYNQADEAGGFDSQHLSELLPAGFARTIRENSMFKF
jgi:hypothetical protein